MRGYEEAIEAAIEAGFLKPGEVSEIVCRHDDFCPMLSGAGYCGCSPDVYIVRQSDGKKMLVTYDPVQ